MITHILTSSQLHFCTLPERLKDLPAREQVCDRMNNCTGLDKRFSCEAFSMQEGKSSA